MLTKVYQLEFKGFINPQIETFIENAGRLDILEYVNILIIPEHHLIPTSPIKKSPDTPMC